MTNDEQHYKVIKIGAMRYLCAPSDAEGYYIRRVCQDGTITFLPVQMPISCQQGTPGGDVPK
jgi:hypothetical protein